MTRPSYPIIEICNNETLLIIPDEMMLHNASDLGLTSLAGHGIAFDSNGEKWTYRLTADHVRTAVTTTLLALAVYSPVMDAAPYWTRKGTYALQELKDAIHRCVDRDDDDITQFAGADTIKRAVDHSTSFDGIYQTLNKYVFAVDVELLSETEDE
jgi:hypothetical protein